MAKNAMKSIQEERESKYGLAKTIAKDVVNGVNGNGDNKILKKGLLIGLPITGIGLSIVVTAAIVNYMQ